MSDIPTAEEFFKNKRGFHLTFEEMLIEFTKLHVRAVLKAASEEAVLSYKLNDDFGINKAGFHMVATKESILNCYPETLIV